MLKRISPYFTLLLVVLTSTLVLWLPFILRVNNWFGLQIKDSNFFYIYKNYDGPLYIIPAKTLYSVKQILYLYDNKILPSKALYFAAHLPLYPLFIRIFSVLFGFLKSMLFTNIIFTLSLAMFFYSFLKKLKLTASPLLLVTIFLFLPRFLVVRSIGAPESLFILLILLSLYFFEKKQYLYSAVFGGLSAMTKILGILLFIAYGLVLIEEYIKTKKLDPKFLFIILIPLGLFFVFLLYSFQYHDFFAYFHTGGVVPVLYPFSVFNFQAEWVGTAWLEDIFLYFFIYLLTVLSLWKNQHRSFFYFSLIFFTTTILIQHRDISRYSIPLWSFCCIAFEKLFTSKKFIIITLILLPAIYFYAWNFLAYNVMPIGDWKPFL